MKLLVVRHGATIAGAEGIILSRVDGELSDTGKQQADELADRLKDENIEAIYSSPLRRAKETAAPLAHKIHLPIIEDERLLEVDMGSFSGKPLDSTVEVFGLACVPLMDSYRFDLRAYGGEIDEQVKDRIQSFLGDLATKNFNTAAAFTHDGTLHWFYLLCVGKKVKGQPNASIHTFEI